MDLDVKNLSHAGMMSAKDQAECCFLCWNRAGCAAAVRSSIRPAASLLPISDTPDHAAAAAGVCDQPANRYQLLRKE